MRNRIAACLLMLPATTVSVAALAADNDQQFFRQIEGQWSGSGEIVAGKYKGTKFVCNLAGTTPETTAGMTLDGSCRVGVFSQAMKAVITRDGKNYTGAFNDGAADKGLDVISGNVSGNRIVLGLNRKQLDGAMLARVADNNTMNVTVSVRVEKELVPVIGLNLKRTSGSVPSNIARN